MKPLHALTATIIVEGNSLNYSEGVGNTLELKKFTRGDGQTYTFISRQALRYDIVRLGNEIFDWNLDTVDTEEKVVQFKKSVTIKDSVEMDLFGYMRTQQKTKEGKGTTKRTAPVRISHGISLEPFAEQMDFQTNIGLATRIKAPNEIINVENHTSYYSYTITVDLAKIGVDENDEVTLLPEEKFQRVQELLTIVKFLNRHIRGRQENLNPKFVIGGVYPLANPFFDGNVVLDTKDNTFKLDVQKLINVTAQHFGETKLSDLTFVGATDGIFENTDELKTTFGDKYLIIEEFFSQLTEKVAQYYGVPYEITTH